MRHTFEVRHIHERMVQNFLIKILLAPFSLLYGLGVGFRNVAYRANLLKSVEFNIPTISVGNLSVGGAGKTPHIEYLIRTLKDHVNVATLSRGYGRKTQGYLTVHPRMSAQETGDEPLQFKRKFPDVHVTVSESRSLGIPRIMMDAPDTQVVLLDDAFQHRAVKPGMNILLTEYDHPFTRDFLLPSGRLREWRAAYERADVIIVSKCPQELDEAAKQRMIEEINPFPNQEIFFSYYDYGRLYYIFNPRYVADLQEDMDVLLISGIARTEYLTDFLQERVNSVTLLEYADHHAFTQDDVTTMNSMFHNLDSQKKVILTTEKDAMRLEAHRKFLVEKRLPIFALPVQVQFHFGENEPFDQLIKDYLLNFKV